MKLNPEVVKLQVSNLRVLHPELLEDDESWMLAIESETDLDAMLQSIVRAIDDAAALEAGTKERLDTLKARKERFARKQDALRELAFKLMSGADVQKREYAEATLSISKGRPELVEIDTKNLPEEFWRIKREPDRNRIAAALKAGEQVPGFQLSNAQPHLTIRTK